MTPEERKARLADLRREKARIQREIDALLPKAERHRNLTFADGRWYVDFTSGGHRVRAFGGWTLDAARKRLIELRADRLAITRGEKPDPAADVSFAEFADDFLETHSKVHKRTWKEDKRGLGLLKHQFKGRALASITTDDLAKFIAARKAEISEGTGRQLTPATINRLQALIKCLFARAVERGKLEKNPATPLKKLREAPPRERILSEDEFGRLMAAASPELKPIIMLATETGMRKGEILSLRWKEVDLVAGRITVANSKSGKSRRIPIDAELASVLGALVQRSDRVFPNVKDVRAPWKAACAAAGVEGVRFHDLRHTALTWQLRSGADIVSVSKIAGHASVQMTQRYITESPDAQRKAVEAVGKVLAKVAMKVDQAPAAPRADRPLNALESRGGERN